MSKSTPNFLDRCRIVLDVSQQVCVKEVHASGCFYIQLLETDDAYRLDEMHSRLQREKGRRPSRKYIPKLGEIVLSNSLTRGSLCRSEVVSLQSSAVRVFHVDYGSYESLPLSRVAPLPSHALQPTRQAIKCCLSNATCLTSDGLDTLRALSVDKELEGRLQWSYDAICYYMILTQPTGKGSIGELLITQGMATPLVRHIALEPGLESVCHMSTVVSPSEMYFHFSSDQHKLHDLQEMMNSTRLSPFKSMAPLSEKLTREGAYCLIQNPADMLKYRARVTCVRPSDQTAQVHLVDFGHTINVTFEQMFSMTPDTAEQPALCFTCSLTLRPSQSHSWGLEARERLLSLGERHGMRFEVCVKNRIGTVHWVHVYTPGSSQPLEDSLSDLCVAETNYYLSMYRSPYGLTLDVDEGETVCITHVVDWNKFFVQLTKHSRELDWLTERLAESFSDTELDEQWLRSPTEGVLCAAPYYEANTWARAVVTNVPYCTADKVQVFYIDYGNRDEVLPYDLKIIPTFAMHHPAMAIECGLYSSKQIGAYNLEEFRALVSQKALYMTVQDNTGEHYSVSLVDKLAGGINILESLERRSQSPISPPIQRSICSSPSISPVAIPMRSLPLNNKIEVLCTFADSPSKFRCQLLSHTDANLPELTRTLQLIARETAARLNTRDIRLGMPIMALNTNDQLWYRAVVLEKEQRGFIVDLVDYGNRIKVQTHEMTHLPIQLMSLPAFGIVCKIHLDIPQKWSEEECEMFKNIILGTKFRAVPRSIERRVYGIDILEQELLIKLRYIGIDRKKYKNINNLKHLLKPLKLDIGSRNRLSISYFENPGHFFCQLEENTVSFNQLQENLAQINIKSPEHINFNEGEYCLSLYTDDNHFYRAKIVTIDSVQDSAEVFYVDYGRKDMVYLKNLRNIPEEFTQLPIQAIHCSLWGVYPIGTLDGGWHSESKTVVDSFLADTDNLLVDVREIEMDKCHFSTVKVEILEPAGLAELLVTEGFAFATHQPVDIPTYTVAQGTTLQVEVTHLAPDHTVYCIPVSHGPQIDQIISGLKTCHSNAPLFNAKVGQCVAARSADSGIWNRARVLSKMGKQKYEVINIDIGTKELIEISDLRHIPSFATHTLCKTFRSVLSHTDEYVASPNYVQVFRGVVGVGTLLCEVDEIDKDELHRISLKLPGGENLIDELVNQGALSKIARRKSNTIYPTPLSLPAQPGDSALPISYRNINLLDLHMSISLPSTSDVVVSHLDNPSNFYIQFANSHSQLQFLGEQINQHYSCLSDIEDTNITPTSIVHGAVCCTRFAQDNLWYRGKVLEVTQNEVVIQYVDYGNRETKSASEIKLMHPNFYALPAQAIRCSLVGVAPKQDDWSVEASQLFQSLTFNKLLQCTFINSQDNGVFFVSLIDPQTNINVAQVLINSRYANPVTVTPDKKKINEIEIKSKSQENVYMSDISNPESFHLHLSSLENNLNQFMDQITSYYGALKPADLVIKSPVPGNMCCCKYLDNNWYRAVIKEVKDTSIHVYFVDYGNLYTVSQSDCKQLYETFYQFPKHSIECCLHDVALAGTYSDWAPTAIAFFKRQTEKQQLVAKFIQKNSEGRWEVTLTQGTRDIGRTICEAGMAIGKSFAARYAPQTSFTGIQPPGLTPTQKDSPIELQSPKYPTPNQGSQYGSRSPKKVAPIILPRGHKCEAYVSYAVSPNDFSVQLTEFANKLDAMMDELARHCERSFNEQLPQPHPQMFVAAKFTEDDKWYRAIVLNTDTPGVVKVHYIDYGNRENLDMGRIKPLPTQLYSLQAQSVKCSLRGFSKDTRFSTELMDKFRHTVTDRYFSLTILQFQNTYYEVDLMDDTSKQSMATLFHVKSSGPAQVFIGELKPLILSAGTDLTAQLCVINSPNDFYMQVAETSEALNSMEFELNRTIVASKALKSFELKVGVPCAACFSTTGTWYRAKVLAVSSPKIHVLYVDYGNDEWLLNEKIQPLPQKFLSLPCQAFRCALRPHQKRYTDEDVDKFKNKLTAARDIRVKIVGHNDQYIYLVELFSQQTNEPLKFTSSQPVLYSPLVLPAGVIDRFKVCHILPSGLFYLQRENAENLLNTISSELTTYASRMQLGTRAEVLLSGSPCAVKYSQDGQWYRGKVIRPPQQGQVEVQFVDYGNDDSQSTQNLLPIPETLLSHPAQAIPAMLQSNHEQGTKPCIRDLEEFQSRTHERVLKVTVISKNQEVHVVKMFFSNDEEITMSGVKPPGYRKGHPGEEVSENNGFESRDKYARHGEFKQRGNEEGGFGGRSGRSEGYGNRERNEGGFGNRERNEGGSGNRDRSEGGSGNRERNEGGYGGRSDRGEGGYGGRERKEGGYGGRERKEGGFGNRDSGEGGFGNRDKSEGGFGNRDKSEGGYGNRDRGEGGYGNRDRGEGGFGNRDRGEGGYGGRERKEGGYGNRDRGEGGYGNRDRGEAGFGNRDKGEGGFGNRDKSEGGFGRSDRGRDRNEGSFGGRSDRGEGEYRPREDRSEGRYGGRSGRSEGGFGSRPDTAGFGSRPDTGGRSDRDRSYNRSSDGRNFESRDREGRNLGDKRERNYGERRERSDGWNRSSGDDKKERNVWGGSEDIRLKSDVLGTQGWAKNAESKQETVHWDTKPELKSTDNFTEERLVINQAYEVYVSYIVSAKEFYCSLTHKSDSLDVVMKKLENMSAANSLTELEATAIKPDKAVVSVFSEDKAWYRAKILTPPQGGFVQVQYVDYGNSEKVPVVNLKTLPSELLELPSQAIPCMLAQEVEKFRENIEAHEYVKIKVTNVDGEKTTVDVFTTDGKIIYKIKPSPVGKKMDVYTSHVISPYEFYCQSTNTNTLDTVVILLSELTNTTRLEEQQLQPGEMCLGVFSEDSTLYRAIIIQVIDIKSKILVQFMDYGNSEVIHPSKISQMPSNISSFPTQAYKCAVVHPTYKISQEKIDQFVEKLNELEQVTIDIKEAVLNQYLLVDILNTSGKPIPLPFTLPTSTSIAEPPSYPIGATVKCGISHITNPTNFYCQNVSITDTLDKLMDNIDNDVTNNQLSKLKSFEDGTQCVAQYSGDNGWYRGVISRSVDAHSYIVQFIDYGNSEKVDKKNTYNPKPEYLAIPPCAFQCGVVVTEPASGWSDAMISEFSNKVKVLSVIIEIVESNMDNYKVRMLDEFGIEEISLPEFEIKTTKVELRCEPVPIPEKPVNVYISFIKSVDLFYLQLSECEEELGTLMEKVHTECTSGSSTAPAECSVGMICLTKFIDDGAWYRSRVEQVSEDQVTVNYIDYGNSQIVSKTDVLSINHNLLQKPFAMPCRFTAGYGIRTTAEVETKFEEYMPEQLVLNVVCKGSDGVFDCQLITQVDSTDDPVDIGKELADLLSEETRTNAILSYCERTATELTRTVLSQTISILTQPRPSYFQRNPLVINSNQSVYLTDVDNQQGLFYVQLSDSDAAIQELMGLIAQYCTDPVNIVKPDSIQTGSPCLAKFAEDDTWYRAEVQETFLEFDHVKVLFMDYGNSQTACIDSIVKISPDLLKTPIFSYACKFTDSCLIPKGFDLSSTLSSYEMESLLTLRVEQTESHLHRVKLSTEDGVDLGQVISGLVPIADKQALFSEQQNTFVNKLIDRLLQDVVSQLETENKHNETSARLDSYANEYVECILLTSQSKLELEEETAIDKLVSDVINTSTNHVTRIHDGFKALPLPTDSRISVNLSHIVSTQCFYVQMLSQAVELFQLTEEVETYCSDPTHITPLNGVETELPVLAVFSQDSTWYRGMVTAPSEARDKFQVRFVDFGNSDEVPENLISHLPDHLLSKASFSYQCRLSSEYNLKHDATTINKFTELTEMKTDLMMEVVDFKEGVYEVRLFDGTEGEIGILMNTLPFFYPDPNDPPHPVTLTCYNSQDSFFLQTNSNQNILQDLQTQMVEYCASSSADAPVKMEQLLPGILVLVYFEESQSWSRAKILANSEFNQESQIQLIDYGPVLMVGITQIRLVSPRSPITMLPPIAFHCKLPAHYCVIDCNPVNEEFVRVRPLTATFNGPLLPNNQFEAEVFDTDKRLALMLEKLSGPSRKWNYVFPPVDTTKNVFVSAVDTVLKFYLQESGSEDVIANLMAKVSEICKATKPIVSLTNEDLYVGMAVLAVFSEDGEWYRGQVLEIADAVRVCFVDYGNVDSIAVSSIRHVPYELLCVAPLAYPCQFSSEIGLVTCPEVEESFQTLTGEVELNMKVLTAATEHVEVELSTSADPHKDIGKSLFFEIPKDVRAKLLGNDTKESIFEEQSDIHTPTESIYKLTLPPINSTLKGITSNIISIQDFYIQDNELTSELVSLTQLTPVSNELVVVSDISVDNMVLAKFSGDDEIYRARVISTAEESINVFFIDYGNSDCVPRTNVYQIPSQQKSYPCYAFPCCLDCDLPVTELTTEKLTEAVEDKDLEVVIKGHKDNRMVVDIFLLDNGEDILEILRESLNNDKPESEQDTVKTVKTESDKSPKKLSKAIDTPVLSNHPALPSGVPSFPELDLEKEDGNKFEATVTHSNNLFSFYLHKKNSEDQINELMDKLLSHCGDTPENAPPPSILPGMAVIAMLDGDGSWYRGQIVEQQGDSYSVFSVDYGNIETISSDQILPIASEFLQEPLAFPCKLYLAEDTPLPESAFDTFSSLLEDTSCQVEVMSVEENMLEVKIEVKEGDVFTQLFKS